MKKYKCERCGNVWKEEHLLYEPLLKMLKCPHCKIFTPLREV